MPINLKLTQINSYDEPPIVGPSLSLTLRANNGLSEAALARIGIAQATAIPLKADPGRIIDEELQKAGGSGLRVFIRNQVAR